MSDCILRDETGRFVTIASRDLTLRWLKQECPDGEYSIEGPGIEWTDSTWNPVRGCTKVSPGCTRCYAETFAERFRGVPGHPYEQGFDSKLIAADVRFTVRNYRAFASGPGGGRGMSKPRSGGISTASRSARRADHIRCRKQGL